MRRNNKFNPNAEKHLARCRYRDRQIDKWWKWSWNIRGKIKFKELVKKHNEYGIKCY